MRASPAGSATLRRGDRVVDERSTEVFRILVEERKAMSFAGVPAAQEQRLLSVDSSADQLETDWEALFGGDDEMSGEGALASRHVDTRLQTALASSVLQKNLVKIRSQAHTILEEQGANILFLALGFLHWYEDDKATQVRKAPLILVPVELSRRGATDRFKVAYTEEEVGLNFSLAEKMKADFGIRIPLSEDTEELSPSRYYEEVEAAFARRNRWQVSRDEIALAFLSFHKFLMYRDLDPASWPEGSGPAHSETVRGLRGDGLYSEPDSGLDGTPLEVSSSSDESLSPPDTHLVLDADSSQTEAILAAMNGRHLVIQGPPGTGKSQTITNLLAECIAAGKRVLFVAEKMAALEVVKRRLDAVGLGDSVLELHSHKTKKSAVLQEIAGTMALGEPTGRADQDDYEALALLGEKLNSYCVAANQPVLESGISPVRTIGLLWKLGPHREGQPYFDFEAMKHWTSGQFKRVRLRTMELDQRLAALGPPRASPFWGSSRTSLLPTEQVR